jgi:hypothetical protein
MIFGQEHYKEQWGCKMDKIQKATHEGSLVLSGITIPAFVLENATRLISQRGLQTSIGLSKGGGSKVGAHRMGVFLARIFSKGIELNDLTARIENPIVFFPPHGGRTAYGYEATILADICDAVFEANKQGILLQQQKHVAERCEILMRAFAKVGIIALIDEATGYQYDRDRYDLERLLAVYLSEERLKWAKMFPDEFYKLIYKLKNWPFPGGTKRTPLIGKITNTLIYEKLPPGVLDKLRELNPKNPKTKHRPATFHQHLSVDIGQPDLRDQLLQTMALLRAAPNWRIFDRLFARVFPTKEQLQEQRQGRLIPEQEDEY